MSAVESILVLDRLRQSVAVKELEQAQNKTLSMRKTASVPNFSQVRLMVIAPCGRPADLWSRIFFIFFANYNNITIYIKQKTPANRDFVYTFSLHSLLCLPLSLCPFRTKKKSILTHLKAVKDAAQNGGGVSS